jgi:hypothetical protein
MNNGGNAPQQSIQRGDAGRSVQAPQPHFSESHSNGGNNGGGRSSGGGNGGGGRRR